MILRRIAEHLRQQHWTAALIELAIVVLGVFIGLQADAWNDARKERAAEGDGGDHERHRGPQMIRARACTMWKIAMPNREKRNAPHA